jgi:CheY-like chemotaxis protein
LVVDDNEINQIVAVEELELAGYRTDVASDGAQALEKVKRGDYLLVLMDCQMPVMDGYTATREIREFEKLRSKHTPIIALTAHAMGGERERVLKAGMDDYLSKPFRPESLRKLMRQHGIHSREKKPAFAPPAAPAKVDSLEVELNPTAKRSKRLVDLFLANVPGQIGALRDAIRGADAEETRAHAHKLKGSCLAIDAPPMAAAAETIQHLAETGDLGTVDAIAEELEERFSKVKDLLQKELA